MVNWVNGVDGTRYGRSNGLMDDPYAMLLCILPAIYVPIKGTRGRGKIRILCLCHNLGE